MQQIGFHNFDSIAGYYLKKPENHSSNVGFHLFSFSGWITSFLQNIEVPRRSAKQNQKVFPLYPLPVSDTADL